jgi:hypothetical protein
MAEQFLADFKSPFINGIAAQRILTNEVLQNIFQGEIESEGRGVTQRFTSDTSGAQIRVVRVLPLTQKARELGAGLNGNSFNTITEQPRTEQYGLNVITVIDAPIDIPNVNQDMLPIDLLEKVTKEISNLVNLNTNAITIAGKYKKSFLDAAPSVVYYNSGSTDPKELQKRFLDAHSKLDDGDLENGVSIFPTDDRVGVIKASYRAKLLSEGVLVLGGSNYAQELLAAGVLSPGAKQNKLQNGYIGDFDGTPIHIASSLIWRTAEEYLGLPNGELNNIIGYFSSGMSNARGVAYNRDVKIIDSPSGQGVRLQPLFRLGFESFYAKGNVFIVDGTSYAAPIKALETIASGTVKLLAPGSRIIPTLSLLVGDEAVTPTLTLGTSKTLLTGTNQYFFSTSNDVALTYSAFTTARTAAAAGVKGTYTSGTLINVSGYAANTYYGYFLAVDNDGTVQVTKTGAVVVTA